MIRSIVFLFCVWTSISVFSKTTIYWTEYNKIAGIDMAKITFPTILIHMENPDSENN